MIGAARSVERWNPPTVLATHSSSLRVAKPVPAISATAAAEIIKAINHRIILTCFFHMPASTTKADAPMFPRYRGSIAFCFSECAMNRFEIKYCLKKQGRLNSRPFDFSESQVRWRLSRSPCRSGRCRSFPSAVEADRADHHLLADHVARRAVHGPSPRRA